MQKKIDPELKARWVANLRSNEFEQYRGLLQNPDGGMQFCCLGVLDYNELRFQWDKQKKMLYDTSLDAGTYGLESETLTLLANCNDGIIKMEFVEKLAGVIGIDNLPKFDLDVDVILDTLTDKKVTRKGSSFNSIADWIEKNL